MESATPWYLLFRRETLQRSRFGDATHSLENEHQQPVGQRGKPVAHNEPILQVWRVLRDGSSSAEFALFSRSSRNFADFVRWQVPNAVSPPAESTFFHPLTNGKHTPWGIHLLVA